MVVSGCAQKRSSLPARPHDRGDERARLPEVESDGTQKRRWTQAVRCSAAIRAQEILPFALCERSWTLHAEGTGNPVVEPTLGCITRRGRGRAACHAQARTRPGRPKRAGARHHGGHVARGGGAPLVAAPARAAVAAVVVVVVLTRGRPGRAVAHRCEAVDGRVGVQACRGGGDGEVCGARSRMRRKDCDPPAPLPPPYAAALPLQHALRAP